jgi:type I restriction enzyme, S subunit
MGTYIRSQSVVFCKTKEAFGGLSNMAGGFELRYEGHDYKTSEHLYQCLRFPDYPDVQELIRSKGSPMGAKMASKPHRAAKSRADWDEVRMDVMRFCLRLKLQSYRKSFGGLLLSTGEKPIVEESRKNTSDVWSARAEGEDMLVGDNWLGLLLIELREEFKALPASEPISMTLPAYRSRES